MKNLKHVNRFEVITQFGRKLVLYGVSDVDVELQDDGRTMKIFLVEDKK